MFYYDFHQIQLRTVWMGRTIKLLDFTGKCHVSLSGKMTNAITSTACLPPTVPAVVMVTLFLHCLCRRHEDALGCEE